jgi:hypothetical protein
MRWARTRPLHPCTHGRGDGPSAGGGDGSERPWVLRPLRLPFTGPTTVTNVVRSPAEHIGVSEAQVTETLNQPYGHGREEHHVRAVLTDQLGHRQYVARIVYARARDDLARLPLTATAHGTVAVAPLESIHCSSVAWSEGGWDNTLEEGYLGKKILRPQDATKEEIMRSHKLIDVLGIPVLVGKAAAPGRLEEPPR